MHVAVNSLCFLCLYLHLVKKREQISAWVLLSVLLPMLILSCFHFHSAAVDVIDCSDCVEHVHHAGHITQHTATVDDCVLCRIIGQRFIVASEIKVSPCERMLTAVVVPPVQSMPSVAGCITPSLRAPPVIL